MRLNAKKFLKKTKVGQHQIEISATKKLFCHSGESRNPESKILDLAPSRNDGFQRFFNKINSFFK